MYGIFVYGMKVCSDFIDLHAAVQCSLYHLLERLSFLHCKFLSLLTVFILKSILYDISMATPAFSFKIFIYLLAVLGLHRYAQAFSSCGEWGPLF